MKESDLVTKIKKYLIKQGAYAEKIWGGGFQASGIPDILACYRGCFVGIEVKVGKNKPSEIQEVKIKNINRAGGYGVVVWSLEEVVELLRDIDEDINFQASMYAKATVLFDSDEEIWGNTSDGEDDDFDGEGSF